MKIKLHAVLPGDQALQLELGAQAALDHTPDDFLLKSLGRAAAAGAHDAFFVYADMHRYGHIGITGVATRLIRVTLPMGTPRKTTGRADG